MHLPNGSWANFGGNDAVMVGGAPGSVKNDDGTGSWDSVLNDFDGRRAVRVVSPCSVNDNLDGGKCKWSDDYIDGLKRRRWYSSAEAMGDGTVVIIGGMTKGGYINRETPATDPVFQNQQSEPTYEYYPARSGDPPIFQFLVDAGGLNTFAHTFLMPDGQFFVQANLSTSECFSFSMVSDDADSFKVLWNHETNTETQLPQMPKGVVRVYPASGATAMLPLTPANDYTPTIIFCGGQDMPTDDYGNYGSPAVAVWNIPASKDCQRITPQPKDGSAPQYVQDEDMPDGRTMGQFIALPDGKYLVINGASNGTAGYSTGGVPGVPFAQMPAGPALASGPVFTPALYDPEKPLGQRWSNAGLSPTQIARMYHSTAILLPDASVLVAGSNSHPDVNLNHIYPTEYRLERFFPPYFSAPIRPAPQGVPKTLSYGGDYFNITLPAGAYPSSDAKELGPVADTIKVVVIRGGFTTHAMNMGQRYLELRTSYTVNSDRSIVLHVSQMPPNSNLFQPGPALLFVNVGGIPSNGTHLIVGNGQVGPQPTAAIATLPENSVGNPNSPTSSASGVPASGGTKDTGSLLKSAGFIGGMAATAIIVAGLLVGLFVTMARRKKQRELKEGRSAAALETMYTFVPHSSSHFNLHDTNSMSTSYRDSHYSDFSGVHSQKI